MCRRRDCGRKHIWELCTNRDQRGRELRAIPEGAFGPDPTSVPSTPAVITWRLETNNVITPWYCGILSLWARGSPPGPLLFHNSWHLTLLGLLLSSPSLHSSLHHCQVRHTPNARTAHALTFTPHTHTHISPHVPVRALPFKFKRYSFHSKHPGSVGGTCIVHWLHR